MKSIRSLGLAVLAVTALFVVPSMASASGGIVADQYGAKLRASQQGSFAMSASSAYSECEFGETLRGELTGPSTTYGLSGTGATCSYLGEKYPVEMNNCQFEFDPAGQTFAVGPPSCSSINATVGWCPIAIPPQTGLPATQSNSTEGDVKIGISTSAAYNSLEEKASCPTKGLHKNLNLVGEFKLAGFRSEGEFEGPPVDLEIITNGALPVGVFASPSKFEAQAYPVDYRATPTPTGQLKLLAAGTWKATCAAAGAGDVGAATSALDFTEFSSCSLGGYSATVRANSCSYRFGISNVSVSCAKEGDKIEIDVAGLCTLTVAAQSLTGSGYTPKNKGEGTSAAIDASSAATGMKYGKAKTNEGQTGCAVFPSNGTNGTFAADVSLSGAYAG